MGGSLREIRLFQACSNPGGRVRHAIAFGFLDQSENDHSVVTGGLETLADERPAGVGPLAGQACELWQAFVEQPLAVIE
jgi:hypothetical protein